MDKKNKIIIISAVALAILIAILITIIVKDAQMLSKEQVLQDNITQLWYKALKERADGETRFKLSDTTPFEWDEVYIGSGYYDKEQMAKSFGSKK